MSDPSSSSSQGLGWSALGGVVMLCLLVARCGDRTVMACDLAGVNTRRYRVEVPPDPNSEEGKRSARRLRDFEAMQRVEEAARTRDD